MGLVAPLQPRLQGHILLSQRAIEALGRKYATFHRAFSSYKHPSVAGDSHEALYVIALTTGLRMGEALGLKWSDIDFDAGTLRVSRQLHRMRHDGDKPGKLEFSEPKNASHRTVALPQRAVQALRSHRRCHAEEMLRATDYEDSELVFATGIGTPLDAQSVVNRHFKPLL